MSMKHPRRFHKKAAKKRRLLTKNLKDARRELREKLATAQESAQ